MCDYEKLLNDANMIGLKVFELNFESDAKGLCYGEKIGIKKDMTSNEKACILAEEIGHFKKTVGNILDQSIIGNKKQEKIARTWAVNKMIHIDDLFSINLNCCNTSYDIAEALGVTEEFLQEILETFKRKYGLIYHKNGKTIIFHDTTFSIATDN